MNNTNGIAIYAFSNMNSHLIARVDRLVKIEYFIGHRSFALTNTRRLDAPKPIGKSRFYMPLMDVEI